MRRRSSNIALISIFLLMFVSLIVFDSHATEFIAPSQFETADMWITDDTGWNAVWDTLQNDTGYDIAVSDNGLLYIAGESGDDAILLQYNALGQQIWNRSWGGTGFECANGVVVDDTNVAYIAGYTTSWGAGGVDAFIAKYDQAGVVIWSHTWGASGDDKAQGICLGTNGEIYICGYFDNIATSSLDIFVVTFDSAGNILSERILESAGDQGVSDIRVTSDNTVFLVGTGQENDTSDFDMMLVALEADGSMRFSQFWGYSLNDSAYALEISEDGNILISGYYSRPGWAAIYVEFNQTGSFIDAFLYEYEEYVDGLFWGYDLVCTPYNMVQIVGKSNRSGRVYQVSRDWGYSSGIDSPVAGSYYGIVQGMNEEIYVVGEGTFDLSTKFVRIECLRHFEGYTYNDDIIDVWTYSGDGVVTQLTVADFTGDEIEDVVAVFYTIEKWWVEIIDRGSLLWSYVPEGNVTQLNAQTAQFDSDAFSELLIQYKLANLDESLLVALDNNGSLLWQWHGNLTDQVPILADLDSDYSDEVCLDLVNGIMVLESDFTVRWKIDGDANTTWTVYGSGDYDQDGQAEIVTSKRSNTTTLASLECIVLDGGGNIKVRFPLLTTEIGATTNSTEVALAIEMANFFGDEKLGFYYVTTDDGIHISEFIVNSLGEAIGYSSPWSEWRNQTWYESCRVIIYDFDQDTLSEILRMTPYWDLYLMDSYGRIIWTSHAYPQLLWTPYDRNDDNLWDFDGDAKPDIITIFTTERSAIEHMDEIYIVDAQTGNRRYITNGIWGRAQYTTDIDGDDIADILVIDVYRVSVVKYGQFTFQPPNSPITALFTLLIIFSIVAVGAWSIYDYVRGLPHSDTSNS
ncbi:MAG: hypothetical protein KGD60_07730 [Candidatus Thorarchaeota archaeon]|nr:hypothetical protein [Candidatus Thorarchaeota archaeon]